MMWIGTQDNYGPLAQLVEQLTLNQRVRSSSLRRPTISSSIFFSVKFLQMSGIGGHRSENFYCLEYTAVP